MPALDNRVLTTLWQQFGDSGPVHKAQVHTEIVLSLVQKSLTSPDLKLIQHLRDELNTKCDPGLVAHHQCDLANALVVEWEKMPACRLQILVENPNSLS